ncbi:SHOCT domain-containing protein [Cellulomonas septica]|uniref:SHOCT domain-containing protein n=1 Tax=Cellulomonas septica TaxID=285080 RepID=A0ABX1JVP4_9CELL|nr:SHOCT domain-containing protein [Cellulomonas septica]NKY38383.1 SHOCT domain-containing protein [Cellulomonas septica]
MPGLIRGVARTAVVAGTASAVSGRVHHRQQQRWADQANSEAYTQQQSAYAQPAYAQPVYVAAPAPTPETEGPDMDTKIAHLKQLAELRDQGVLTPAEFEVQKAQILAS